MKTLKILKKVAIILLSIMIIIRVVSWIDIKNPRKEFFVKKSYNHRDKFEAVAKSAEKISENRENVHVRSRWANILKNLVGFLSNSINDETLLFLIIVNREDWDRIEFTRL